MSALEPCPDEEAIEWPREIWAAERGDHDVNGWHVFSEFATVPRWEGDRDCEFHQYIDSDIHDSAERYYKHQLSGLEAENERLRDCLKGIIAVWDGPSYKHYMRDHIDLARAALTPKGSDQ